jgi:hypothetical protein
MAKRYSIAELHYMYVVLDMSQEQMSKILGIHQSSVGRLLQRRGIYKDKLQPWVCWLPKDYFQLRGVAIGDTTEARSAE